MHNKNFEILELIITESLSLLGSSPMSNQVHTIDLSNILDATEHITIILIRIKNKYYIKINHLTIIIYVFATSTKEEIFSFETPIMYSKSK